MQNLKIEKQIVEERKSYKNNAYNVMESGKDEWK